MGGSDRGGWVVLMVATADDDHVSIVSKMMKTTTETKMTSDLCFLHLCIQTPKYSHWNVREGNQLRRSTKPGTRRGLTPATPHSYSDD